MTKKKTKTTKKTKKKSFDSLNKEGKINKKKDNRGGYREGAGRKPDKDRAEIQAIKGMWIKHGMQKDRVQINDYGKITVKEMERVMAVIQKLYSIGMKGNIKALDMYLDRVVGKPNATLDLSGSIDTNEQYIPENDEALKVAKEAYRQAILKRISKEK